MWLYLWRFSALLWKAGKGHVGLYLPRIELRLCSTLSIRKFVRVMSLGLSAFVDAYMSVSANRGLTTSFRSFEWASTPRLHTKQGIV
jgi:hypothetical protein